MGLIENMLISVVHLAFVAADVLLMVVVLKIIYDRWQIPWMEPILTAVKPVISVVLNWFASLVLRATGKSYHDKTLLILLIICLLLMRFLVVSITG